MFGHQVGLNFNKQGSTYTTMIGGMCSVIVKIMLSAYVLYLLDKLYYHKSDIIMTLDSYNDLK